MILATDRTDLPGAEHAGDRTSADSIRDASGVVVGLAEEPMAPTVAGEHQSRIGVDGLQQGLEVFRRRVGVSNMELQCGADRGPVADPDGARTVVGSENAPNEEVTAPKLAGRFVDDEPDMEPASHECLGLVVGVVHEFAQPLKRGRIPSPRMKFASLSVTM